LELFEDLAEEATLPLKSLLFAFFKKTLLVCE